MKTTIVGMGRVNEIRFASTKVNKTLERVQRFARLVHEKTGIQLSLSGKPVVNYKTQDAFVSALTPKGSTLFRVETNLRHLADALEQYHLIYSELFKKTGPFLIGDPEVEVAVNPGIKEKITEEWLTNIIISNIFNCALHLKGNIELDVHFKDIPIPSWKDNMKRGGMLDWNLQLAHETFLCLFLLEEAMNKGDVKAMMGETVSFHEIRDPMLQYAKGKGLPIYL